LRGAGRPGTRDTEKERPVLGAVVGRAPDALAAFLAELTLRGRHDGGDRGRSRVAARAPVDVDDEARHCARRSGPSALAAAFQALAASSSSETSSPFATSRTPLAPPFASTSHWYQESSHATVTNALRSPARM